MDDMLYVNAGIIKVLEGRYMLKCPWMVVGMYMLCYFITVLVYYLFSCSRHEQGTQPPVKISNAISVIFAKLPVRTICACSWPVKFSNTFSVIFAKLPMRSLEERHSPEDRPGQQRRRLLSRSPLQHHPRPGRA